MERRLVHFEKVSDLKIHQLVMCSEGELEAHKFLGDITAGQRTDYDNLRSIMILIVSHYLWKRFQISKTQIW